MHIELTCKVPSAENLRVYFDQARRLAPDDDLIWLGCANLAIRTRAFDVAKKWLDACKGGAWTKSQYCGHDTGGRIVTCQAEHGSWTWSATFPNFENTETADGS